MENSTLRRLEELDHDEYNMVVLCLTDHLRKRASEWGLFNYSHISHYLQGLNIIAEPYTKKLFELLGDVSEREHNIGCPLVSVIVVNKETSIPGEGFFKLAKELGVFQGDMNNKTNVDNFIVSETTKAFVEWGREYNPEYLRFAELHAKFEDDDEYQEYKLLLEKYKGVQG